MPTLPIRGRVGSMTLILAMAFAFLAGFIDAIAGGGGLIQLPALFILFPDFTVPMLLATNKFSSMVGTTTAVIQFRKQLSGIIWRVLPMAIVAALSSAFGARLTAYFPEKYFEPLLLILVVGVGLFTIFRPQLGTHTEPVNVSHFVPKSLALAAGLGLYDGFFGPGTGSFLVFGFVLLLGYNFLSATAASKVINLATNIGAVVVFLIIGCIPFALAVPMACANMAGGFTGSRLAIRRGNGFVRWIFIAALTLLSLRFAYDLIFPKT